MIFYTLHILYVKYSFAVAAITMAV